MSQEAITPTAPPLSVAAPTAAAGGLSPWRVLHVEPNLLDAMKLKLALHDRLPVDSQLMHVSTYEAAEAHLAVELVDAVLVGYSFGEAESDESLRRIVQGCSGAPVVVLSVDSHTEAVMRAGRLGAQEFLPKEQMTGERLASLLWPLIVSDADQNAAGPAERRKAGRHECSAAAVVLSVTPDGRPGVETPARLVNLSRIGLGLLVDQDPQAIPDRCVVGVEGPDGQYRYATVEWRQRRLALPSVHLGGRFVTGDEDLLDPRQLTPRLDPQRLTYAPPMDPALLQAWASRGVLRSRVVDRVKSCPECYSLLSYRDGCQACGSFDTEPTRLIHHFACAHVGPEAEFGLGAPACPKCRNAKLVVGADFEYIEGPHKCRECSWSDAELSLIAECMSCGKRADAREAIEKDVVAYYVNRLDPMALVEDAR
ncbi:hypothetical protein Pla123a_39830 [Posidoniimonas polymericola]|uniref:Response regulatory domain-containing protein n=1 Tax=Posidoniimonas polymericola TaxID=2528002 RepID=A0A5C5YEF3_9BACT|nr:hypothetical protein [Posidoniimonas polymericola]TWT72685.1 hypothetical protein Pla123a_39830 [Posidoniimonas polymericola]